jgi:hypothetical protein
MGSAKPLEPDWQIETDERRYGTREREVQDIGPQVKLYRQNQYTGPDTPPGLWGVPSSITNHLDVEDAQAVRDILDEWLAQMDEDAREFN